MIVTQREHDIWLMIAGGMQRKEIASALGLHRSTIENYVDQLYRKLGAHSVADALRQAVAYGLVSIERKGSVSITNRACAHHKRT